MSSLVHSRATSRATRNKNSAKQPASSSKSLATHGWTGPTVSPLPAGINLWTCSVGEHYAVHDFLLSVFRRPSNSEFQAQLDNPSYEPIDRLILKRGNKIVAHVRQLHGEMKFAGQILPVTMLCELGTDPDFRQRGCASNLIAEAERRLAAAGSDIGLARSATPDLFRRRGWVNWDDRVFSQASTREVLSVLSSRKPIAVAAPEIGGKEIVAPVLSTRIWRHVEQSALIRLYDLQTQNLTGPWHRREEYWRWLISRHGYDQVYVAIDGKDRMELDEAHIVSYAVVRQNRIVELLTDPAIPHAATKLLGRICGDFIEQDANWVRYDGIHGDAIHQIFAMARGTTKSTGAEGGATLMAKLVDPWKFLEKRLPKMVERAVARGLSLPAEIGLCVGNDRRQLQIQRDSALIVPGKMGRACVTCDVAEFTQMLLGHLDWPQALSEKKVQCSGKAVAELAELLFPRIESWLPPWDSLAAR